VSERASKRSLKGNQKEKKLVYALKKKKKKKHDSRRTMRYSQTAAQSCRKGFWGRQVERVVVVMVVCVLCIEAGGPQMSCRAGRCVWGGC
jgi:nitrogenase subunit NifH